MSIRTIDGTLNLFRSLGNVKIKSEDIDLQGDLSVNGDILLPDNKSISFGDGDLSILHDEPSLNKIQYNKQIQFTSTMTSGDSIKYLEQNRRDQTILYASNNASGVQKVNYYQKVGNNDVGATNKSFFQQLIRRQDNGGLHAVTDISQTGNDVNSAMITHYAKTKLENELYIKDEESIFFSEGNKFQMVFSGGHMYFDEQGGSSELLIRTDGPRVSIRNLTDNSYIASFNRLGSCDLYYNGSGLKLETKTTGIDVTGVNDINSYTTLSGSGWNNKTVLGQSINTNRLTTITIDLESNKSAGNGNAVGIDNSNATYLARVQTSTTGIVYKIEVGCIEAIAGGAAHLALYQSTTGTYTHNQTVSGSSLLDLTNSLAVGDTKTQNSCTDLSDDYIYLVSSTGSDSTSLYTAGKLIIKLYGSFF